MGKGKVCLSCVFSGCMNENVLFLKRNLRVFKESGFFHLNQA